MSRAFQIPSLEECDRVLPRGLKASYCLTCGGRTVVIAPAVDNLQCARCSPSGQRRLGTA